MNKLVVMAFGLIAFICGARGQNSGFFSNEIVSIASSGDSISLLSWKFDKITSDFTYAVSYVPKSDSVYVANDLNWKSFVFPKNKALTDFAFGSGYSVVVFDTVEKERNNIINVINHKTNATSEFTIPWNASILKDSAKWVNSTNVVYLDNAFYFACRSGGIVKWDIATDKKTALLPGVTGGVSLDTIKGIADSTQWIRGLEVSNKHLIATSPSSIWVFSPQDSTWVNYTGKSADPSITVRSFLFAVTDPFMAGHALYSSVKVTRSGYDTTILMKYSGKEAGWKPVLDNAIAGLTFSTKGYYYTYFEHDSTNCTVYRDTLGDTAVQYKPLPIDAYYLPERLKTGTENPQIYDIFFSSKTDSSGVLYVGTSNGLYISRNEIPGKSNELLQCVKRITPVKNGLKEAFASPGILKNVEENNSDVVRFVYCLSKNANVTIRIYDYNNDLVKTIIEKQPRKSGTENAEYGRSNDKYKDVWDGTTAGGRVCAPGVYYFKITTDIGEHAFGKVVVAK
jgi:hypothetical protein